jgi:hypothetical protein
MKKIISLLLVLVLSIGCTLALTSCGSPELDFNVAKANLEAAGYDVEVNEDNYSVNMVKRLTAEKDDDEILICEFKDSGSADLALEEYEIMIKQAVEALELEIEIIEHLLEDYADDYKSDEINEMEDELKELKEQLAEYDTISLGSSGCFMWYGTKAAVEATKG